MADPEPFRRAIGAYRRALGRTQRELARAVGLHPSVLSHKLHGGDGATLTQADVVGIVVALAGWGALATRGEARALLALMAVPPQALPAAAWSAPPLAALDPDGTPPDEPPVPAGSGVPAPAPPLPAPPTALIGREAERAAVRAALAASRLVTLTGVGGTGKTRLALAAAHEAASGGLYAQGVAFVDLAPLRDAALLPLAIGHALGLADRRGTSPEAELCEALRPRQLLLVLDNLEHLLEEVPLLARLLAAAPRLHILATSRVPLRLYGEHELRVPPLALAAGDSGGATDPPGSEAVRLFVARARAVAPAFAPAGEALAAVAAICAALDGLPLAIELAAARVKLFPPEALLPRLAARLTLLTGGPRDLPERQRTMRAAIDWSYALLVPDEQALFAGLGVFAGPFDASAAAAVCDPEAAPAPIGDPAGPGGAADTDAAEPMLGRLAALADQSLLEVAAGQAPRFRLLGTVRAYALARLAEAGGQETARDRHLRHQLALAEWLGGQLKGPEQGAWLARLEDEHDNLREALGWARESGAAAEGLRLAAALRRFWALHGHLREGQGWLEALLALPPAATGIPGGATPALRARALRAAGSLAWQRGDYPRAHAWLGEALALCRQLGDGSGLATVLTSLGNLASRRGDYERAAALHAESLALKRALGDEDGSAVSLGNLGRVAFQQGDHPRARALLEECLALKRRLGDAWGRGAALNSLGRVAIAQGDRAGAAALLEESLGLMRGLGDPRGSSTALCLLGRVALLEGDLARAEVLLGESLRLCTGIGARDRMAEVLESLAEVSAAADHPLEAARRGGAAEALREALGTPLPREQREGHERMVRAARRALGEAAFAAAWSDPPGS